MLGPWTPPVSMYVHNLSFCRWHFAIGCTYDARRAGTLNTAEASRGISTTQSRERTATRQLLSQVVYCAQPVSRKLVVVPHCRVVGLQPVLITYTSFVYII